MNDSQSGTKMSSQGRAAAAAGEHPQRAAGRRRLLCRSNLPGAAAALVADVTFGRAMCGRWPNDGEAAAQRAPHEVLDPRDLKYCRNICDYSWAEADDRFRWRRSLPLAPWGAAELLLMGGPLLLLIVLTAAFLPGPWKLVSLPPAVVLGLILYFFRNPRRSVPQGQGLWVSPADGTIAEITQIEHDDFVGGPAVRIGIFLSIFNVHLNRSPAEARVIALRYSPGEFLNALRPESAIRNENMWIGMEEECRAASAICRAADFRRDRPADRLRLAARRGRAARSCLRHDQARLANGTDRAAGGGA